MEHNKSTFKEQIGCAAIILALGVAVALVISAWRLL